MLSDLFEELRAVMNETEGLLPKEHQSMLVRLLDLELAQVEDVMIPKNEIHGIDITESWVDIVEHFMHAQRTRIPLYEKSIDNLVGIVHVRSILQLLLNEQLDLEHILKMSEKPIYIPAGKSLTDQILQFRVQNGRSGFVVNEYGEKIKDEKEIDDLEEGVETNTNNTNIQQIKNSKKYTPINSYKPSGKLVYSEDLLNKIENKIN